MIVRIFSIFDPRTTVIRINWIRLLIFMVIIPLVIWIIGFRTVEAYKEIWELLLMELKLLLRTGGGLGILVMIIGLFRYVLVNNIFGLIPYVFTRTAHFCVVAALVIPFTQALGRYGWRRNPTYILARLVPRGTPKSLIVFMVLIETVRDIIRPMTLVIRLRANMIAGHLLIALLGGIVRLIIVRTYLIVVGQILLLILEIAVAFIQSYVLVILLTLYFAELR